MAAAAPQKILVLEARNLGDAVIGTGLVNSLGASFPEAEVSVWTRPTFKDLFAGNPRVKRQHHAHFPMGTIKQFGPGAAWRLCRSVQEVRRERYDLCINTAGDFRENFLGWLARPRENAAVVWPAGHRYRPLVRPGLLGLVNRPIPIPPSVFNVYAVHDHLARELGCTEIRPPSLPVVAPARSAGPRQVGLHPYASQRSKLWPWENWRALLPRLQAQGWGVQVFCAPAERPTVEQELRAGLALPGVSLSVGSLPEFFRRVAALDLLVALDSFSVHAAHALGTPGVLLNGANDIGVWAPPTAAALSKGEGNCPWFPCYNKPRCGREPVPFICLAALTVDEVADTVFRILAHTARPAARSAG